MLPTKKQEMHFSCSNLLNLATCMDVKSILHKKFALFTLTMINQKWQCLNKLTSKWLNHRINTDMQELENVLLEVILKSQRRCWPSTCVNYWFFSIECTKVDVIFVSIAWNACNVARSRTKPNPIIGTKLNYQQKYTSKAFSEVNINKTHFPVSPEDFLFKISLEVSIFFGGKTANSLRNPKYCVVSSGLWIFMLRVA